MLWLQDLESTESRWALVVAVTGIVLHIVLRATTSNPMVDRIWYPTLGLIIGLAVGWPIGELFVNVSGIAKVVWGGISALFAVSVTLDKFRERTTDLQQKILYLFALFPITGAKAIAVFEYIAVGFIVAFFISIGVNATRKKEKAEDEKAGLIRERDDLRQQVQQLKAKGAAGN